MIRVWRYWIIRTKEMFLVSQFALLAALLLLAAFDREMHSTPLVFRGNLGKLGLMLLILLPQICSYFNGLDTFVVSTDYKVFMTKVLGSLVMGFALTVPLFLAFPKLFPGYAVALAALVLSALLLLALRPLYQLMVRHRKFVEGVLILGTADQAGKFYRELLDGKTSEASAQVSSAEAFKDCGEMVGYSQLREITRRDRISRIVVAEPNARNSEALAVALLDCKLQGLQVEQAAESYEKITGKVLLEALCPEWLVYSGGFKPSRYYLPLKRFFDTTCALLLMVPAALLFPILALLIKRESSGPVFFRQTRVGVHGKQFVLLKFRTMRADAEQATGPVWASESDQRITRLGKYLRKFRLDELPQLLNVIRGDMSLIGPRPERPYFVDLLSQHIHYYGLRHCVKPGITGWAQVLYPYGASVQDAYEKLQYDLYYAKHMSLSFDLGILVNTMKVVIFGRGR